MMVKVKGKEERKKQINKSKTISLETSHFMGAGVRNLPLVFIKISAFLDTWVYPSPPLPPHTHTLRLYFQLLAYFLSHFKLKKYSQKQKKHTATNVRRFISHEKTVYL